MQVDPCPFFLKSCFCPRLPLCKLDHRLPPGHSQQKGSLPRKPINPTNYRAKSPDWGEKNERIRHYLGSPKRFHPDSEYDVAGIVNSLAAKSGSGSSSGIPLGTNGNGIPDYFRSLSSPAGVLSLSQGTRSSGEGEGDLPLQAHLHVPQESCEDDHRVSTLGEVDEKASISGVFVGVQDSQTSNLEPTMAGLATQATQLDPLGISESLASKIPGNLDETRTHDAATIEIPEVPKQFDFAKTANGGRSSPPLLPESVQTAAKDQGDGGVFFFTGSNPTSPERVPVKRKNAAVGVSLFPPQETGGDDGVSSEEVAMLAQQLDLESDNVSLSVHMSVVGLTLSEFVHLQSCLMALQI